MSSGRSTFHSSPVSPGSSPSSCSIVPIAPAARTGWKRAVSSWRVAIVAGYGSGGRTPCALRANTGRQPDRPEGRTMGLTDQMRDGYASYSRRDYGFVDQLFGDDIRWNVPGPQGELH